MSTEKSPCITKASLDKMDAIAEAHIEREECFVNKFIKKFSNSSCIPRFLKTYPDLVNLSSNWCDSKTLAAQFAEPIEEILTGECPAPCTSISYEKTMEPYIGVDNVIPFVCGAPAVVINFKIDGSVSMFEVRFNCSKISLTLLSQPNKYYNPNNKTIKNCSWVETK